MNRFSLVPIFMAATVSALFGCTSSDSRETPGEKAEWSVLQGAEYANRSIQITTPMFKTIQGYEVMGVHGLQGHNIWVLLKVESPPFYKQMPNGNYELPIEVFEKLVKERRLSYAVEHVLLSHISTK